MTDPGYPAPNEQTFDLKKVFLRILRNWYWVAFSVIAGYSIGVMINRYTDPQYSVSATLIINDERKSTAEILINTLDRFNARKNVENEIAILKSYRMAFKAISELDYNIFYYKKGNIRQSLMYKNSPFKVILDTTRFTAPGTPINITLLSKKEYEVHINGNENIHKKLHFGEYFRQNSYNFTIVLNNPDLFIPTSDENYVFTINSINSLASQYASKLNISTNDRKGTVLTIQTTGAVAQMESDYVNKLMEVYIRTGLEEKNQTAINTINFIDEQLAIVVDSLNMVETKMQSFKTKSKMMAISEQGEFLFNKVNEIQKNKVSMEVELRYYEYLHNYLKSKNDFSNVIAPTFLGITETPLAQNLSQLVELYKERKTLLLTATKNNPAITVIDDKIRSSLDALEENLSEAIKLTSGNIQDLNYNLQSVEAEMVQLPSTERRLLSIQRAYKLNDQIYNFLLQKRADAAIAKASNVADNKILDISRPENSFQISPKKSRNKMAGILLGSLIPIGILFLIEFFNPIISDPNDLKKFTRVPVIGSIGHNERDSEIPVSSNPQSAIAESFRALRTNLQYYLRDPKQKIICITSTISGEGKTFTAVNLAAIIAQSSKKTLLVSLDLRKPKIHKVFNFENKVGLSNYLIEKANYEDIVFKTNIKNLSITPAGPVPPNPAELIETPRMEEFFKRASQDFDMIVLDTPPLAVVTDASILLRHADASIFVVRLSYSAMDVLKLVEELNTTSDIKHLGIVLNDITYSNNLYGRKYGYKYGYSYGYGYGKGQGYYLDENDIKPKKWWKKIFS